MPDVTALEAVERPVAGSRDLAWGSDAIAEVLRRCRIPYIALVPGSSYRGLQDSLVNYLGNENPQMLVCLHEEHAVAIAHGYSKVTERAMAAAVHSNVGLMHALMAVYNAYCDRAPILLLGATGPVDATRRRPWIDWIHTSRDQGALLRGFVKWDEQPGSPQAGMEATLRALLLINAHPRAPAYVCFDVADQERPLDDGFKAIDVDLYCAASDPEPSAADVAGALELLRAARRPLILAGRVSRSANDWSQRVRLAEALGAQVVTDLKTGASFPTAHALHIGSAGTFLSLEQKTAIANADVILSLDWMDLGGALLQAVGTQAHTVKLISASVDDQLANGWSYDHYALPPVTVKLSTTPDIAVRRLLDSWNGAAAPAFAPPMTAPPPTAPAALPADRIDLKTFARTVGSSVRGRNVSFLRFPLGWPAEETPFAHPLDYLGADGGAGIGSGPGISVGAALALRGSGRIPVAIVGDGDFAMGASAIWTAARYRIPLLVIVSNNRSYFNDETHQEAVARTRGRPADNKWIGQRLDDPAVDNHGLARSFGCSAPEQSIERAADLAAALHKALAAVEAGQTYVLDVRVTAGYASAMPASTEDV